MMMIWAKDMSSWQASYQVLQPYLDTARRQAGDDTAAILGRLRIEEQEGPDDVACSDTQEDRCGRERLLGRPTDVA